MKFRLLFLLLFAGVYAFAQNTDEELAAQYLADGEYDKAQILYEKLLKKSPESVYIYENYFLCLTKTKDFDGAEKLIKKQAKRFADIPLYKVDEGYLLTLQGKEKEAAEVYAGLIKNLNTDENQTIQLANAFVKRNLGEQAITTLETGRKIAGYETAYSPELITLYQRYGAYKKLCDESLQLIGKNDNRLDDVKNYLVPVISREADLEYLRERTLLNLQKFPGKSVYDELLLWVFLQKKEYRAAYRQAVALDKKSKNDGLVLLALAVTCLENSQYDVAADCYNTVIQKGETGMYYLNARMGLLDTRFSKLSKSVSYSTADLDLMEQDFKDFLSAFGKSFNTATTMKQQADFYIYYKHDLNAGITILEELAVMPRVQPRFQGECKLSLGDAYLIKGEIWDAQLLYAQVDKDFAEDPLGQEAKFRNARLSYFTGDFDWAKDQLDVLKTATSQLISNNAIEQSMVIMDNTGLDSTTDALQRFADAELLFFQNRLPESLAILNLMPFQFPKHSLEDDIYLLKARIYARQGNFADAQKNYETVFTRFGGDILADNALIELARLCDFQTNEKAKAMELYKKLVFTYTGSLFTVEARKRIAALQEAGVREKP